MDRAMLRTKSGFQREARDIVSCMKKGIYMVGFPDVSKMKLRIKEAMEEEVKEQTEMLRKVKADKRCLGREMFAPTFWEKGRHCFISS